MTNNPAELLEFKKKCGEVVYKPVAGGAKCQLISEEDLTPERLTLLSAAPVIFQKLHAGDDIRVFVLNGKILCALLIETEALDYRGNEQSVKIIDIPDSIAQMCISAVECCRMTFSGVDLKHKNGEYVLLECNPSPMFIGFEKSSGYPISDKLANYLVGH